MLHQDNIHARPVWVFRSTGHLDLRDRQAGARPQRKRITPPHPVAPGQRSSGDHRRNKREGTRDVRHGLGAGFLCLNQVPPLCPVAGATCSQDLACACCVLFVWRRRQRLTKPNMVMISRNPNRLVSQVITRAPPLGTAWTDEQYPPRG